VDATILSPIGLHPTDLAEATYGSSLVLLGERALHAPVHHVAIDNVAAATTATNHLIGLGRRRIAAIGDQPGQGTAALRLNGYLGALRAAGLTPDPMLTVRAETYSRAEGAAALHRLMELPEPPDAIFCFNDLLAIGALRAARDRGLAIPEDLAIVGFDDVDEGNYSAPRLTTIAPDKAAIAEAAVNLARATPRETTDHPQDVVTPFTLVVRDSAR
jgi:DNA-binding LacI/PurR family transcriptional regulator